MIKHHTITLRSKITAVLFAILFGTGAQSAKAAPPDVATSIKPVQALVKMVMGNLGTPDLIMPATASPHVFSMKPSQAKLLENADVIFWIGPGLETTLQGPLENIADKAQVVELLKTPGLDLIAYDHGPDEHGDEHGHGAVDPHIWLSPSNAHILLDAIAASLSQIDPDNAQDYAKNAKKGKQRIKILIRQTASFTKEMQPTPYLVQHDGFGYLAREFNFNERGAIQTTPGREPSAKHVSELLAQIKEEKIKCIFHESQFSPKLARSLEKEAKIALREIDPMGIHVSLSETTYVRIIQGIIVSMETCLYPRQSIKLNQDQ